MFKMGSIVCMVGFYITILIGAVSVLEYSSRLWLPDSALAASFGAYQPIFGYIDIHFEQQPGIYMDSSFLELSFITTIFLVWLVMAFLWYMRKLLRNIYQDSLFMQENVSIIFRLGVTIMVLGSAFTYTDGLILSKALTAVDVSNATIQYSNISYIDAFIGGVVLLIIASAMKIAVEAVEENKKTI